MKKRKLHTTLVNLLPLFLILFIDSFGVALIFPLLSPLLFNPDTSIIPPGTSNATRDFLYSAIVSAFSVLMLIGAPLLGLLSDKFGRKPILLICLIGSFIGYALSSLAILTQHIGFIIIGRGIDGFTAGSQSIAQAAIVDISTRADKTRYIGFILLATSSGLMMGPLVAGVLSDHAIVSWFNLTTPFDLAALIALFNLLLLMIGFKETFVKKTSKTRYLKLSNRLKSFISLFRNSSIRKLSLTFLFMQLGWASYFQFIALLLSQQLHFSNLQVGLFMMLIGVGFAIAFSFLVRFLSQRFSLQKISLVAITGMSVLIGLTASMTHTTYVWLLAAPAAIGLAIGYSTLISIFSNQVDAYSQGSIMGITGSMSAFAFIVASVISGVLAANISPSAPMWFACGCLAVSAIYFVIRGK